MTMRKALQAFGLDEKEQEVYLLLVQHPLSTILSLSRIASLKRSTLYRVIESLQHKGLVAIEVDEHTTYYSAGDPKTFESLTIEQEERAKTLRSLLGVVSSNVQLLKLGKTHETHLRFYRGIRGLKTMNWNTCKEKNTPVYILGNDVWFHSLGEEFAEEIREEYVRQRINVKEIINRTPTSEKIPSNGKVSWTKNHEYVLKYFRHRFVSKKVIDLQREVMILPNQVYFFDYSEEPTGIEISSKGYAELFIQLFRMVWNKAESIDTFGGSNF